MAYLPLQVISTVVAKDQNSHTAEQPGIVSAILRLIALSPFNAISSYYTKYQTAQPHLPRQRQPSSE